MRWPPEQGDAGGEEEAHPAQEAPAASERDGQDLEVQQRADGEERYGTAGSHLKQVGGGEAAEDRKERQGLVVLHQRQDDDDETTDRKSVV